MRILIRRGRKCIRGIVGITLRCLCRRRRRRERRSRGSRRRGRRRKRKDMWVMKLKKMEILVRRLVMEGGRHLMILVMIVN